MEVGRVKILAFGFGKFELGRHRDPELKALDPLGAEHSGRYAKRHWPVRRASIDTAGLDDAFAGRWSPCRRPAGENDG